RPNYIAAGFHVGSVRRMVQRRLSSPVFSIRVGSELQQQFHSAETMLAGYLVQNSPAIWVALLHESRITGERLTHVLKEALVPAAAHDREQTGQCRGIPLEMTSQSLTFRERDRTL